MHWSSWGGAGSVRVLEEAGLKILFRKAKQLVGDANFVWFWAKKKAAA